MYDAPVNRIKITGYWASKSLLRSSNLSFFQRIREYYQHSLFLTAMFSLDVAFWLVKVRQVVYTAVGLMRPASFEDELERGMRAFAKGNLGVDVDPSAFRG